jgi:hypothetical protein
MHRQMPPERDEWLQERIALTYGSYRFDQFIPLETASAESGVTQERLIELVNARVVPHVRIDGGPPLFIKSELRKWVVRNAVSVCKGRDLPAELIVLGKDLAPKVLPPSLAMLQGYLLEYIPHPEVPPCVYFLIRGHAVVYVGMSNSLPLREAAHAADKEYDRIVYICVPPATAADLEKAFIRVFQPEYNKAGVSMLTADDRHLLTAAFGTEIVGQLGTVNDEACAKRAPDRIIVEGA